MQWGSGGSLACLLRGPQWLVSDHSNFVWGTPPVALTPGSSDISCVEATRESGGFLVMNLLYVSRNIGSSSVPNGLPWGCLLTHWNQFGLQDLRKKKLILCNTAWPQYSLGDDEKWPVKGPLNLNIIYQLDLFCKKQGKWTEVPYVQAFTALHQDPDLRASCRMCLSTSQVNKPPFGHTG